MTSPVVYDVVVPTIGRPSLAALLGSLDAAEGPAPGRVILVDDRRDRSAPLEIGRLGAGLASRITVLPGFAAGPAAARNRGWRFARAPWIVFLDDDVVVTPSWRRDLQADLQACDGSCVGSQGNVTVPMPADRRPTDWERNVRGLEGARYITADCAYARATLERTGGFDERFPRAYREDAELALRVLAFGGTIATGTRRVLHPVRHAGHWISVRLQAGNADDVLIEAIHGRSWNERAEAPRGRFGSHVLTVLSAFAGLSAMAIFALRTASFAVRRIAPGPRDAREVAAMLVTSVAIPFAAVYHRLRAVLALPQTLRRPPQRALAVLFDRDGTLVEDDPALRDPDELRLVRGAVAALASLRDARIPYALVTNQPRVGSGELTRLELDAIHRRIAEHVGPFATVQVCAHVPDAGCSCRKPAPGLVFAAAEALAVAPGDCVLVGDIGSDIAAARAAGARAVLVPTDVTRADEVRAAPLVARDLTEAVRLIVDGRV